MTAPALEGIRVLDLSDSIAGQYCSRLLADFGAEVVLVEPGAGSPIRRMGPFRPGNAPESLLFFHLNTGKRSVVLDGSAERRATLARLAAQADVAVVGPGADRAALVHANPDLVVGVVSPFGEDGPLAGWKDGELIVQALSGMMNNNGEAGRPPLYGCGHRASYAAGVAAFVGILAALRARSRAGGQEVAVDVAETAAAMCFPYVLQHNYNGAVRSRADQRQPVGEVCCRDGWVCIWIYNHRFAALCGLLGLGHLVADPRFADPADRRDNWPALIALIEERVRDRNGEELVAELQAAQIIAAKAYRPTELIASPHLASRGYWETIEAGEGSRRILGPQFRLARTPRRVHSGAPVPGEADADLIRPAAPGAATAAVRPSAPQAPPLAGLRVIEITTAWAGPMAGRILAFLGADVIHVEAPTRVNSWRLNKETPNPVNFPAGVAGARFFDRSFLFNSQNVNKRSLVIDLKKPAGAAALARLAAVSDVVTCNFRPGTLAKLGLGYDAMSKANPGIIVAEMPAYGLSGPMAGYAALGPTMEMAAGMSALIGYGDGRPVTTGPSYLDPIGGFHGAAAILTALHHRDRTGEGQAIEVPQVEAAMHFVGEFLLHAAETGTDPAVDGNRTADAAPHDAYPAAGEDEWVAIAATDDAEWRALATAIGRPDLAADPRFADLAGRMAGIDAIDAAIAAWTRTRSKHEAAAVLQDAGVPAAPVNNPADLAASPYLAHRGFFTALDHPDAGRHLHPGLPVRLSRTPGGQHRAAPPFGHDNEAILRDLLGMPEDDIAALAAAGVLARVPNAGA